MPQIVQEAPQRDLIMGGIADQGVRVELGQPIRARRIPFGPHMQVKKAEIRQTERPFRPHGVLQRQALIRRPAIGQIKPRPCPVQQVDLKATFQRGRGIRRGAS